MAELQYIADPKGLFSYLDFEDTEAGENAGGGSGVGLPVGTKVYRALLTQAGTNAPTATVLENTIGVLTWGYDNQGTYQLTSAGLFSANKTIVFCGGSASLTSTVVFGARISSNIVQISSADISAPGLGDDLMTDTPIEIIVYP